MANKEISSTRKVLYSFILVVISLVIVLLVGEGMMRLTQRKLPPPYDNKEKDAVLGWRSKPFYTYSASNFMDCKGGTYPIDIHFTKHGFRKWNERAFDSTIGTALFIGDSYTESLECSDSLVFYSVFKDSVPVNLYACGTAGYGTIQEMQLLDKYIDSVKPKWIILQTCSNDYLDNYWMMEMLSGYHVGEVRPYLVDGKVEYHYPRPWYERVKDYSLFLNFILERSRQAMLNLHLRHKYTSTEDMVDAIGKKYPPYATSLKMTEEALKHIKQTADKHNAKLLVYILGRVDSIQNGMDMDDVWTICEKNGIPAITGATEKTEAAKEKGEVVNSFDGYHYNPKGQKILGEVLIDYFRTYELNQPNK